MLSRRVDVEKCLQEIQLCQANLQGPARSTQSAKDKQTQTQPMGAKRQCSRLPAAKPLTHHHSKLDSVFYQCECVCVSLTSPWALEVL